LPRSSDWFSRRKFCVIPFPKQKKIGTGQRPMEVVFHHVHINGWVFEVFDKSERVA
jgi:hypothetical protein